MKHIREPRHANALSGSARFFVCAAGALCMCALAFASDIRVRDTGGAFVIMREGQDLLTYVFEDDEIPRPYFKDLFTPQGTRITRHHPPIEGEEPTDHATYHPGLWMAFGDIDGADFWRNEARVQHERFVEEPAVRNGQFRFAVENSYRNGSTVVCREVVRYSLSANNDSWLLTVDSQFSNASNAFTFGDQEEMGLGVRVAAPIMVENGGTIVNSQGKRNEAEVWGKTAAWCTYAGVTQGTAAGVVLLTHPDNFRPSWFHARDYGLLLANPFGRAAFTSEPPSAVAVEPGESLRLRFGVRVYEGQPDSRKAGSLAYEAYTDATE